MLGVAVVGHSFARTSDCFSTGWPSERSDLLPDPTQYRGKLENGFRYVIKENHLPENRVAVYLDIQAGSLHEEDNQRGIAHFLEHMMFKGSTHFAPGSLVNYFQSIGMDFGSDANAYTSHSSTIYTLVLPSGSMEDLDSGLLVMSDYAGGALLLEKEIESERGVILAEKRTRDSAEYRNQMALNNVALEGTRYPLRLVIGLEKTLVKADRHLLKSYYDQWYRPENMVLVVVGDIDTGKAEQLIQKHFSALKPRSKKPQCPDFGNLSLNETRFFYNYEPEIGKTRVAIQNFWDLPLEDDSLSLEKRELVNIIGSMAVNDRLKILQEFGKIDFSTARYSSGNLEGHIGYNSLSAAVLPSQWSKTLSSLEMILRQVLLEGFTTIEVEKVKKEILAHLDQRALTASSEDSRTIAGDIINHLNTNRVYQSAEEEKEIYGALLKEVSVGDVNEDFRRRWSFPGQLISVTGDVQLPNNGENLIAATYKDSQKEPLEPSGIAEHATFPYLHFPYQKTQTTVKFLINSDIHRVIFQNGLIVNLRETSFEKNILRLRAEFGKGKQSQPSAGMALLAEEVIERSGSGKLPQSAIDNLMSASSVKLRFNIGEDSFSWAGSSLKRDFEFLCQMLQTRIFDPGVRPSAFTAAKNHLKLRYEELRREIEGAIPFAVQPFLAGYNRQFGLPAWNNIEELDYDTLAAWIHKSVRADDLEISIVGDFDRESVLFVLSKYFSGMHFDAPEVLAPDVVHFPKGDELKVKVDTSIKKSLVIVAWPTGDFWDIHRTRRLQVLAGIFNNRLRKVVREKLAASYSPHVTSFSSKFYKDYGYLFSKVLVKPGDEEMVKKEILKISGRLQKDGISMDELDRVKWPIMTSVKEDIKTNQYWLHSVLAGSSKYPQQLDWSTSIESDHESITKAEVELLAQTYLDNKKAAVVIVKPLNNL